MSVEEPSETAGQENARRSAESYLDTAAFSRSGLIKQLQFEGYSAADASYGVVTRRIRERLEHHAARSPSSLPSGLIHGDLFRDNVLWQEVSDGTSSTADNPTLLALLDFESASAGVFIYDVMVCVHAWCYGSGFDLSLVRALLRGYGQERALEPEERAGLVHQGALAALRFATTRLTDFSLRAPPGQPPARDFRRFLQRLEALESGVLSSIIDEGLA